MNIEARPNTQRRKATLGELFFAPEQVQELVEAARSELARGEPEDAIRERILQRADDAGLSVTRILLPSLSRKVRRLSLRKLLHQLADVLAGKTKKRSLQDALDELGEALGFPQWLADSVLQMARTGETSPMFGFATGHVTSWNMGADGAPGGMTVWAVATPHSDPRDVAKDFLQKCVEVFPDETFSRYAGNVEAARFVRRRMEKATFEQIAEEELGADELARLDAMGPAVRKARVNQEADRIHHAVNRFMAWLDSFESGTVRHV